MKALVSALALLSFVGAATVPSVAFAQDPAATTPVKKKTKHKSTKASSSSTKSKKSSKAKKAS